MPKSNMPKHDWSRCLQLLVGPKRPKQNDKNNMMKVCMQETESVMSALHSVAEAQLSPASRPRARTASLHANDSFHLPSAMSATPATQNDGGCEFVPRLPRKPTVDVSLCHACYAKCRGVTGAQASPSVPPSAMSPTPATQNDGRCEFVPRLPRKPTVDVSLCHARHAKCRGVTGAQASPSAPPSAVSATPAT